MASPHSSAQIRLLLVEDVPQVSQYIRNLLAVQTQVKLLDVVTDGRAVLDQIRELGPDVVIVDALLQGKVNGLEVLQTMREAGIDLPIIALTVPQKPIAVGSAMGVARVLPMPFSGFDFMNFLQEAHAEYRARSPEAFSRVYAVYGAKGGIGTTTIAYNLAVATARVNRYGVVLIDGSLQQSRAIVDTFAAIGYPPEKVRYLVNRADATGGLAKDVIEQQIGRRPDFQVVSDGRLVLEANNRSEPFVIAAPEAPISGDVVRIAQSLSGSAAPATVARA